LLGQQIVVAVAVAVEQMKPFVEVDQHELVVEVDQHEPVAEEPPVVLVDIARMKSSVVEAVEVVVVQKLGAMPLIVVDP
jgi:hypothetical protein